MTVHICFHGSATIRWIEDIIIYEQTMQQHNVFQMFLFKNHFCSQKMFEVSTFYVGLIVFCLWIHTTENLPVKRTLTQVQDPLPSCSCTPNTFQQKSGKDLLVLQLFKTDDTYYDLKYWEFQRPMGEIGGTLEQWKFRDFISTGSKCLDFGAGGGFLLHGLDNCKERLGIELNPHAVMHARTVLKIQLKNDIDEIPDEWADVIFSNHALEHVLCPWCELKRLYLKLKKGSGRLIFVVPAAGRNDEWAGSPDVNFHLYSWSSRTLGNLVSAAGFTDVRVDILAHQWPDDPMSIYMSEGENSFIAKGQEKNRNSPYPGCEYQIRVVASRPL